MAQLENVSITIMTTFLLILNQMVTRSQIDFSAEVITQFSKGYQIPFLVKNGSIQYITIFSFLVVLYAANFFHLYTLSKVFRLLRCGKHLEKRKTSRQLLPTTVAPRSTCNLIYGIYTQHYLL